MVNEAAARLWAAEDPIGRSIRLDVLERSPDPSVLLKPGSPELTIVGVLANTRNAGLQRETQPTIYLPFTLVAPNFRQVAVRTQGDPAQYVNTVRREVQAIDKDQAVQRPITLLEILGQQTVQPRFTMALFSFFALVGTLLAAAGIFSLISYQVARRTHEIGVRVALGARTGDISSLVLRTGVKLVCAGILLGMAAAWILVRTVRTQVFDLSLFDVRSAAGVITLLIVVGLLASYLPARRAAGLDPMAALRQE